MQFGQGDRDAFTVKFPGIFWKKYMYIFLRTRNIQKVSAYFKILYLYTVPLSSSLPGQISVRNSNGTVFLLHRVKNNHIRISVT